MTLNYFLSQLLYNEKSSVTGVMWTTVNEKLIVGKKILASDGKLRTAARFCASGGRYTNPHNRCYYQRHIGLFQYGLAKEYIFNFCIFNRLKFLAGRFPNDLPDAML